MSDNTKNALYFSNKFIQELESVLKQLGENVTKAVNIEKVILTLNFIFKDFSFI